MSNWYNKDMKVLDFAFVLGKLKKIKRTGWIRNHIPNPESVAEHSFRMSVLAMILAPKIGADINKSVKMALIHDIGEAEIGDIVTRRGIKDLPNLKEKIKIERESLLKILSLAESAEYVKLFDEFEENKTIEAKFVKQLDKLEMAIQAIEYEKEHKINLQEFFDHTESLTTDKDLKEILNHILKLRKQ